MLEDFGLNLSRGIICLKDYRLKNFLNKILGKDDND